MTEKELAYMEDAVMHEQSIIKICTETISFLEDESLKEFIQNEVDKHTEMKNSLTNLLEVHVNE